VSEVKTKQVNKEKEDLKPIEIIPKSKYEELVRRQDKIVQKVEDLEGVIKHMRFEDTCVKGFIFRYLKPRYRPWITEVRTELWSADGKHYYTLNGSTFEPTNIITSFSPWGLMGYNKPMNNNRYWKLEKLAEEIAGPKCSVNFSDPKEDEGFDRIGRCMI
jgi:hypothetical protein